jgi:formamidopyrimidine-DNA glycosylase
VYRQAAMAALHRSVASIDAHDQWFLKEGTTPDLLQTLVGSRFTQSRRIGKLLLLDAENGATLGLRFGMTGRLVVDGTAPIDELLYSSHRADPAFVRFAIRFADGGRLEMSDPRRLGGVALDPQTHALGPDAATINAGAFAEALRGSTAPIKARLLDQSHIAGIGNLIADEVLWRAGVSPLTPSGELRAGRRARLHETLIATIANLQDRGGSHLGDLMSARTPGARCPRCTKPTTLRYEPIGGRKTYWCPRHQR